MPHQVFLSYAPEDREIAERICSLLEADSIRCWVSPRDVDTGVDEAAATLDGIRRSDLVLLIFTAAANSSPYVLREIERAVAYDRPVLSLHLDGTAPNDSIEYYLNLWQWLDIRDGVESRRDQIVRAVRAQLGRGLSGRETATSEALARTHRPEEEAAPEPIALRRRLRTPWLIAAALLVLVAVVVVELAIAGRGPEHNSWTNLSPKGTLPQPRWQYGMVYEPETRRMIMFGGNRDGPYTNDTWAYDPAGNAWQRLRPSGEPPPPRWAHAMAYDPSTRRVIVFGGSGGDARAADTWMGTVLNDTWAYSPVTNTWTDLKPAGPVPGGRLHSALVYDPNTKRLILFGGGVLGAVSAEPFGDMWAFDPLANRWTELHPQGPLPPARLDHGMVYDPGSSQMILVDGEGVDKDCDDTWAYDPRANSWIELKPNVRPSRRTGFSMVYDTSSGRVILFGGYRAYTAEPTLTDTWAYDRKSNTWTQLHPTGTMQAVSGTTMVLDPPTGRLILFGGAVFQRGDPVYLGETWAYTP